METKDFVLGFAAGKAQGGGGGGSYQSFRPNYALGKLELRNWIVRTTDDFEIVFKVIPTLQYSGVTWPPFFSVHGYGESSNPIACYFNCYNNLSLMNFRLNGVYSGDRTFPWEGQQDYTNYYKLVKSGATFSMYRGSSINDISELVKTLTISTTIDDTDTSYFQLFKLEWSEARTANIDFYYLNVFRDSKTIHNYIPSKNGLFDTVDKLEFSPEISETSNPKLYMYSAV